MILIIYDHVTLTDWRNDAENTALDHRNKYILKYIKNYETNIYIYIYIYIQSWSELLAPLVNMSKEGCKNNLHCLSC